MSIITVDARMWSVSGIGTYLRNLLPRLVARDSAHQYHLLGDLQELGEERWAPRPHPRLVECRSPIYSLREQLELWRRTPRDTALFWSPHYNVPVLHRGRLLVTIHDVFHLAMPQYVSRRHQRLYAQMMFGLVRRKGVAILCDSQFTAHELVRLTQVERRKIRVVHLGVHETWFAEPGPRPYARPYFVFVGNVKPHKNLAALIRAFGSLVERIPHDLVVVGRREGFITGDPRVERLAAALGERVHFTGLLTDAEVHAHVAHAEALLLPSLYEGFGLPALEAMACGCPVIVSHTASLPEVCGEAALYCDPLEAGNIADKMRLLLREDTLREELIEKGRERARRFQWDRCAQETGEVLEELLAG